MTSLESLVWIVVRSTLGIFLPVVLAAIVWVLSRLFLQYLTLDATVIYITQSLIVGIPAGIGAVAAWWNADAPPRHHIFLLAIIPPVTAFAAWLTVEIRGAYTYFGLLGGSHRVPVIDLGDLLGTIFVASLIAANAMAASVYLYRLIRLREI